MTHEINEENIRVAAYYIWEQAGRPEGKDKECWIQACEQLFAPKAPKKCAKKVAKPVVKAEKEDPKKKVAAKPVVKAAVAPKAPVKKACAKKACKK